jgi:hypothetical protein
LFLYGPVASGKTAAALCLCDIVVDASYTKTDQVADQIMAGSIDWSEIGERQLAILDEIGEREKVGDLQYQAVKRFADVREARADSVAIYISNCDADQIQVLYDDRVATRLACGTVFHLDVPDRRLKR